MFATIQPGQAPGRQTITTALGIGTLGIPPSRFPASIATDADLAVAVNRLQTRLTASLGDTALTMRVDDASRIVANMLLSLDQEVVQVSAAPSGDTVPIIRGFDGTTPAVHSSGAAVSGFIDAYHHNSLASEIEAIEQALGPNLSNIPASLYVSSAAYNFPPQTPGGSLIVGANSIVLSPVPKGINGTDPDHWVYISGGTGTPEAAKIIGGTAVAGQPSGTLIIQCANAHSGAWQISSIMGGIPEAYSAISAIGGTILVPAGITTAWGPVHVQAPNITIAGVGWASVIKAGANAAIAGGIITSFNTATGFVLRDIAIDGNRANNGTFAVTGQQGQWIVNISSSDSTLDRVEVRFSSAIGIFVGDSSLSPKHVLIKNCYIHNNGGVTVAGSAFPTPGGFGVGVMSGGSAQPNGLTIRNCHIKENSNTVTSVGDSCAMNLIATELLLEGNYIVNNYNRSGGQIVIGTAAGSGGVSNGITRGNVIVKPGSLLGDHTTGIEVNSSYNVIDGNTISDCESGIYIEDQASYITVIANVVRGTSTLGAGVYVAGAAAAPSVRHVIVNGNMLSGLPTGVLVSPQSTLISITNNDVSQASLQPIAGVPTPAASNVEIIDNLGFNGNFASGDVGVVTVGPSPFVYTAGPRPESLYITGGTITGIVKFAGGSSTGLNLTTQSPCAIHMAPNSQIAIVYTVAPTVVRDTE